MRTLYEIIEDVKTNRKPDYEELRYALLASDSLSTLALMDLRKVLFNNPSPMIIEMMKNDMKYSKALNKSPKEWLGWSNDPENPEYQLFHKMGLKLVDKAIKGELPNQIKPEVQNDN